MQKNLTLLLEFTSIYLLCTFYQYGCTDWEGWWSYSGISGPDFWGIMNHDYRLCSSGKRQSPVNIDPASMIYDHQLKHINMDQKLISGILQNTGHDIRLTFTDTSVSLESREAPEDVVMVWGGPLSYHYTLTDVVVHFGSVDNFGSEHTVDGRQYPGEVQILGYNRLLYDNYTQASNSPNGLVAISIFLRVAEYTSNEFSKLSTYFKDLRYRGANVSIPDFSLTNLVPSFAEYMTYTGSETRPGCKETVTWVILNKPLYLNYDEMRLLRRTMQRREDIQQHALYNNFRPTHPLNGRYIRTNINLSNESRQCSMRRELFYEANANSVQSTLPTGGS